jgi:hypothetical protein
MKGEYGTQHFDEILNGCQEKTVLKCLLEESESKVECSEILQREKVAQTLKET